MKQQFTIQAVTDCTIEYEGTIEYSIDYGHTWKRLKKLSISATHEAKFRNAKSEDDSSFIIEGKFNVYGHISTLAPYGTKAFKWLFYQTNVVDASKLIIDYDELWPKAYYGMFSGCTNLTTAPSVLPATTLADFCYQQMFNNCTSLRKTPELPAKELAKYCYAYMFDGCTSLTTTTELPATVLTEACYGCMFAGCTSLRKAPKLPATTLATECYYAMFQGCKSLTTAPELPATKLERGCYKHMFQGCNSIKELPTMPKEVLITAIQMGILS